MNIPSKGGLTRSPSGGAGRLLRLLTVYAIAAGVLGPTVRAVADAAAWWNGRWAYRKVVAIPSKGQRWSTSPVCKVWITTGGQADKRGRDVRVADSLGREMPCRVEYVSAVGRILVLFSAPSPQARYYVYYGNRTPGARTDWNPKIGLTLLTRQKPAGNCDSLADFNKLVKSSTAVYGKDFRENVFDGFNPFGPSDNYLSIYDGYIRVHQPGKYGFATMSDDASFLLVNGKLVCSWPGWHGPYAGRLGQYGGELNLPKGVHHFQYLHVEGSSGQACVAAWKRPDTNRWELIPPYAFKGPLVGRVVGTEKYSSGTVAGFDYEIAGDLEGLGFALTEVHFEPKTATGESLRSYNWDFGDGVTSTQVEPSHVYLSRGNFTVSLRIRTRSGRTSRTHETVPVTRRWSASKERAEQKFTRYRDAVRDYPFEKFPAADLVGLAAFFGEMKDRRSLLAVRLQLERKADELVRWQVVNNITSLGDLFFLHAEEFERAREYYEKALSDTGDHKRSVSIRLKLAELETFGLGNFDKAERLYAEVLADAPTGRANRAARLGLADVARQRGDYNAASELLSAVEPSSSVQNSALAVGARFLKVQSLFARGEIPEALAEVDEIDAVLPVERLKGETSLLRARCYYAMGRHRLALAHLEPILSGGTIEARIPDALILQGDTYQALDEPEKAGDAYKRVVREYPDSPLHEAALRKIGQLP